MPITLDGTSGIALTGNAGFTQNGNGTISFTSSLAVTGGGTGLTNVGASGNVLTSNGAYWVSQAPITTTNLQSQVTSTLQVANGGTGLTSVGTSGNVLTSNGTAWVSATPVLSGFSNIEVFTSSGTFTVPAGVTKIKVTVIGGGGGGNTNWYYAGGGGGGAAIKIISGLTPGSTVSVTVGAGGAQNTDGGTSSFGAYCSATGGKKGTTSTNQSGAEGGIGTGGDLNIRGGGTGGGYNGINQATPSPGGSSILGGGGFSSGSSAGVNGGNGGAYGGGGGGTGTANAGSGAAGVVIVEY